ncbi:MAG: 2-polyprenyl-3-methyl-5-hydroxy-6-metoxy-1,4-benzoquinol methylase [Gammaproteobacteria bacterium]|jgi:2-polyprenyl-3-methyl-5-hydroxy-6-metoxy-1,4-benzoquinol methylase
MADTHTFDKQRAKSFTAKVLGDMAGAVAMNLCVIGDRLGLFKDLAANGPADAASFATRNQVDERYALEWLEGLAAAEYLDFDPVSGQFTLPSEHSRPLAEDSHPLFQGNLRNLLAYGMGPIDELTNAFKHGGGVHQSSFPPEFYATMQCSSGVRYENFLMQTWLPDMPDVVAMLERGVDVADVGCGQGTAMTIMANSFPKSRFWGYDAFAPQIEGAIENSKARGVGSNAQFEVLDGSGELPRDFDIIFTFDVIHDMAKPREGLANIQRHLKPGGIYVLQEITAADERHENRGPAAIIKYGMSMTYCMTTSLAHHGEGLGTLGMSEKVARDLCIEAGFGKFRKLDCSNDFISLFEVRAV